MVNSLLLATFIRTLLVIVSYGCKVPAGIFVPSMAIGATFGRMVGILVKALYRFVVFLLKRYQTNPLRLIGRTQLPVSLPSVSLMSHV
jgi:Voltage gated chloride channel